MSEIQQTEQRSGLIAPCIAMVLALIAGGAALQGYADHRYASVAEYQATKLAQDITAQANPSQFAQESEKQGFLVRMIEDQKGQSKYSFLRKLKYQVDPERQGKALDPNDDRDKASADAFLAALGGAKVSDVTDSKGHLLAKRGMHRIDDLHVAAADAKVIAYQAPWFKLLGFAILGFVLWGLCVKFGPRKRWPPLLGFLLGGAAILTPVAMELFGLDGRILGDWASKVPTSGELIPVAAALLPIVGFGVYGMIRRGVASPNRLAFTYITPAMLGMALLILVPFAIGVGLAFMHHDHGHYTFVGLRNFIDIISSDGTSITDPLNFYFTLGVTILWTLTNVFLHVAIGLALALILKNPTLRFKGVYRVLLIVPWAVPSYITALVWKGMFNKQYGLINNILETLGIEPIAWFGQFWTSFSANLTTNTWLGFPFMMVVALGALQSIPTDLYEAAEVDGANQWQQFKKITLPLLMPALLPSVILGSIWTFNMFNIIYLVSGGQPNGATDILIVEAYRYAFEQNRYGYAAAYSMLIFFILWGYSKVTERVSKAAESVYG